jgi:hypothetical protein
MYTLPSFPLTCNIWHDPTVPPLDLPDVVSTCNLAWGKRVAVPSTGGTGSIGVPLMTMTLLLPPRTDLRGDPFLLACDIVEVPASSGRLYRVAFVDDIGKGFANEHRAGILAQVLPMPVPMP